MPLDHQYGVITHILCVLFVLGRCFQAKSKFFQIRPSQPKLQPNFSKKKAWIPLDFLVRNEPFQAVIVTPWLKNFLRSLPRHWPSNNGGLHPATGPSYHIF
jgi:hypothetical protein